MAAWNRPSFKTGGRSTRYRRGSEDEVVQLDTSKGLADNVKTILNNVITREGISKAKRLAHLNAFVKLSSHISKNEQYGLSFLELLSCIRISLFHEAKEVRAAGLRCMRYLLYDEQSGLDFLKLNLHFLACRSLDIALDNQIERVQVIRLIRKFLMVCPDKFPMAFGKCLISIANDGMQERDRLLRAGLATLSELALLNSNVFVACGGVSSLLKCTLHCQLPRINEALVAAILFMLNHPSTRCHVKVGVDLEKVLAPYTDCHYHIFVDDMDHLRDDKESVFMASKSALLSILRSWAGMIRICKPDDSGLKSLVNILYLPNIEIRKNVMDVLFDAFRLPIYDCTDDLSAALMAFDPLVYHENWKLFDGFVAEEGACILPNVAEHRVNLVDNYMSLLLFAFATIGLLEALVEVIITGDKSISVQATVLLGELLFLINRLMPTECNQHNNCLPTLMAVAASFEVSSSQRLKASSAITYLNNIHSLKRRGPLPCSLFLDQLMQLSSNAYNTLSGRNNGIPQLTTCLKNRFDDFTLHHIKDTQVTNSNRQSDDWDWLLIDALLKMKAQSLKKMEDNTHKLFIHKLVYYFKPTSKLFSRLEMHNEKSRVIAGTGCHLMDFLVETEDSEAAKSLEEFLLDFGLCLSQVAAEKSPVEALLSPNRMQTSCGQYYFLFIGRLGHNSNGRKALERTNIYQYLLDIVSVAKHDCYNKLIISSLDYVRDGLPRIIFTKILTASSEPARLYGANFMRVLVRLQLPEFHTWGIELLVSQLYDKSRAVSLTALDVLDEACELKVNLDSLIQLRPSLLHLGDRGLLLLIRFLSSPVGFKFLSDANFVINELERWRKTYNLKYVRIVEDEINDSFTHHQRRVNGSYGRRTSQRHVIRDVFVPHHLYGQLVQHKLGLELFIEQGCLSMLLAQLKQAKLDNPDQIQDLKAALWALGHVGTSEEGISMLNNSHIISEVVKLAEECPVYSVRGTSFYVLGLMASTRVGADFLSRLGWESLRRGRNEAWPLVEEPDSLGLEDTISSVGSLESQLADLELDDSYSGILERLDEGEFPERRLNRMHFTVNEYDEGEATVSSSQREFVKSPHSLEPRERRRGHLLLPKDTDEVTYRRNRSVTDNNNSDFGHNQKDAGKTFNRNWSQTLPLLRGKPSVIIEPSADGFGTVDSDSWYRQRSRSVTHRSDLSDNVSDERTPSSVSSSPRSSFSRLRMAHKLRVTTSREWLRSKSFNKGDVEYVKSNFPRFNLRQRFGGHVRSASNVEIGLFKFGVNNNNNNDLGLTTDYGDTATRPTSHFKSIRSDSNDSSKTSNNGKSRSNSYTTDSTSGFSSADSSTMKPYSTITGNVDKPHLLSPIASSSSINTMSGRTVHHSDSIRKSMDLRKTPLVPSRMNTYSSTSVSGSPIISSFYAGTSPISPEVHTLETSFTYTSSRDAQGLATLRSLQQKRRGFSTCIPPDPRLLEYNLRSLKTRSLDSRLELPSLDSSGSLCHSFTFDKRASPNPSLFTQSSKLEKEDKHYVGLCLPVDITMIFNEDFDVKSPDGNSSLPHLKKQEGFQLFTVEQCESKSVDGLELHLPETCIGCFRIHPTKEEIDIRFAKDHEKLVPPVLQSVNEASSSTNYNRATSTLTCGGKSRGNSLEALAATTPGSSSSTGSNDHVLNDKHLNENSSSGRTLLRKEILRFIVNLSSSIAIKSAEQGLLNLKQIFPNAFQDLCLYSEICHLMSIYNFRLSSRRFIQELFLDLTFIELYEEPLRILEHLNANSSAIQQPLK